MGLAASATAPLGMTQATFTNVSTTSLQQGTGTTLLTSSLDPSTTGQSVTFTATVAGASPTGTVTFTLDGAAQPAVILSGGVATFTPTALAQGTHSLTASYSGDANNAASQSSPLTQTVLPPLITVSPASAVVSQNAVQQFTAVADDQSGNPLSPQPPFTWAVGGGGSISPTGLFIAGPSTGGPFTVTARTAAASGTAAVSVNVVQVSPLLQINAGGAAVAPFAADADFTGGSANSTGTAIDVTAASAAPMAVYQTGRYGTFSYAFPGLTPGAPYLVRLHFAETYWNAAGKRVQNVTVNGSPALTNFDIFAAAGAEFKAVVETVPATADASGKITVAFVGVAGSADTHALVAGLELLPSAALTVATAASATPNPVTGTTTAVSVLGADAGGESGLTYTWAATGPAPVTFSANGTNAAKNATATFTQAGTYTLTVTIADAHGATVTGGVVVTVLSTLTGIAVAPSTATVGVGQTQTFTATALDQFGVALGTQPAFTWAATGAGTVSTAGLFTGVSAGPATVTAASGSVTSPAAAVVVTAATTTTALASSLNPSTASQSVTLTATVTGAGPTGTVTFTLDGAAQPAAALTAGKATLTTAALAAGPHQVTAAYSGDAGNAASASATLTQTVLAPAIAVTPATASVVAGGTQQFTAVAKSQGGAPLSPQPAFAWAVTGGGAITPAGLLTAGGAPGGPFTVTASAGGASGAASVTVTGRPALQLNAGGPAASPFAADRLYAGGSPYSSAAPVSVAGVASAAPASVYQTERFGNFGYALSGLRRGGLTRCGCTSRKSTGARRASACSTSR